MSSTFTKFFDYKDDKSAKFWEVTQAGSTVTVRYGKTGTNGQTQEKVFADTAAAIKHVEKIISEKDRQGLRGGLRSEFASAICFQFSWQRFHKQLIRQNHPGRQSRVFRACIRAI
ncbi:MAG: WGR domain-containing protein [Comamonadaceae bacterium]|nr:WGR domain-containing protein [Comamonadaceae bacterium]